MSIQIAKRSPVLAKALGNRIWTRQLSEAIYYRPDESDLDVFAQIFGDGEYDCLRDLKGVELVVDCGANVGYSAVYFLEAFPGSQVIAVEPDRANFDLLVKNTSRFGGRIQCLNAAVWPHPCSLAIEAEPYRDGRAWAIRVHEVEDKQGAVRAVTIEELISLSARGSISLLKVDIEGAELALFGGSSSWIHKCDNIVVELHDSECERVFLNAIAGQKFEVTTSGERTVCRRDRPSGRGVA